MRQVMGCNVWTTPHKTHIRVMDQADPLYINHPNATDEEITAMIDGYYQGYHYGQRNHHTHLSDEDLTLEFWSTNAPKDYEGWGNSPMSADLENLKYEIKTQAREFVESLNEPHHRHHFTIRVKED